jgi:hypothetical protein
MSGMNKASVAARAKWSRIIAEQRHSGMSAARFCDERGIWASSFFSWKRKLAGAGGAASAAPPPPVFVEAKVGGIDDERGGGVMIEVVGGRRIIVGRGFDRQLLLEVIGALEPAGGSS